VQKMVHGGISRRRGHDPVVWMDGWMDGWMDVGYDQAIWSVYVLQSQNATIPHYSCKFLSKISLEGSCHLAGWCTSSGNIKRAATCHIHIFQMP
jgi:hypothetical protein